MKLWLLAIFVCVMPFTASAAVTLASAEYVDAKVETKVDTSATAKQVMAGEYTVTGSFTVTGAFKVPTPPLPNPDAD